MNHLIKISARQGKYHNRCSTHRAILCQSYLQRFKGAAISICLFIIPAAVSGCSIFSAPVQLESYSNYKEVILREFPIRERDGDRSRITAARDKVYLTTLKQCSKASTLHLSLRSLFGGFKKVRSSKPDAQIVTVPPEQILYFTSAVDNDTPLCFITMSERMEDKRCHRHTMVWRELNDKSCHSGDPELLSSIKLFLSDPK